MAAGVNQAWKWYHCPVMASPDTMRNTFFTLHFESCPIVLATFCQQIYCLIPLHHWRYLLSKGLQSVKNHLSYHYHLLVFTDISLLFEVQRQVFFDSESLYSNDAY